MSVIGILHYGLQIPDVANGIEFFEAFGLIRHDEARCVRLRADGRVQDQVQLFEGPGKQLHHLALAVSAGTLEEVAQTATAAGGRQIDPPAGADEAGIWLVDPEGNSLQLLDTEPATWRTGHLQGMNVPGRIDRIASPVAVERPIRPRRLGHVMLWTVDLERQLRFYRQGLGLLLSDRGGAGIAFLRCPSPIADHHHLALAQSDRPGFHHGAFEVGSLDEIVMGAEGCASAGFTAGWGLGRHMIGSNLFHYVRDPWGSFAEYFTDIDVISASCAWEPQTYPEAEALYRWGPEVPDYFLLNTDMSR